MKEQPALNGKKSLGIHFGFLADPIGQQLKAQGFKYDHKTAKGFNSLLDSILTLNLAGLITDNVKSKALDKLYKKILAHVKKVNKLK